MGKDLLSLFILASFAYLAFSSASRQEASSFNRAISTPRHLEDDPAPTSTADTTNPTADGTPEDHTAQADHTDHAEAEEHGGHEHTVFSPDQPEFWGCLGMAVLLCLGAGVFSGLTVGYLSIDQLGLELKMKNGTDKEKSDATVIMPILAKHHLLISTLLLGNALVMESLPLFLDAIMPAAAAIIVSTSAVVLFGEIIPQAYCTGPKQIQIAVTMAPVIKFFIFIFYPICYPISLALDAILGLHQKTRFVKKDLKALVELHELSKSGAPKSQNWGHGEGHEINADAKLTKEEVKVINSTIDLRDTPVTKEMEKIEKVFMLSNTAKIDQDMLKRISRSGFSKVPVYKDRDKNNILGFIRVKTLLDMDRYEGTTIENSGLALNPPLIVAKDTSMLEMLILFQEKKTSVALVSDESVKDKGGNAFLFSRKNWATEESKARLIGLVSLKDLFEEILESKMGDEDVHGAVTLQSARDDKLKKRFGGAGGKSPLGEIKEAVERPEKGMARSPYGN